LVALSPFNLSPQADTYMDLTTALLLFVPTLIVVGIFAYLFNNALQELLHRPRQ